MLGNVIDESALTKGQLRKPIAADRGRVRDSERIRREEFVDLFEQFAEPWIVGQPRQRLPVGDRRPVVAEHLATPGMRDGEAARHRLRALVGSLAAASIVAATP